MAKAKTPEQFAGLMHIRAVDPRFNTVSAHGGMTVGYDYVIRADENGNDSVFVVFAVAVCSNRDNFQRPVARKIVRNRIDHAVKKFKQTPHDRFTHEYDPPAQTGILQLDMSQDEINQHFVHDERIDRLVYRAHNAPGSTSTRDVHYEIVTAIVQGSLPPVDGTVSIQRLNDRHNVLAIEPNVD